MRRIVHPGWHPQLRAPRFSGAPVRGSDGRRTNRRQHRRHRPRWHPCDRRHYRRDLLEPHHRPGDRPDRVDRLRWIRQGEVVLATPKGRAAEAARPLRGLRRGRGERERQRLRVRARTQRVVGLIELARTPATPRRWRSAPRSAGSAARR